MNIPTPVSEFTALRLVEERAWDRGFISLLLLLVVLVLVLKVWMELIHLIGEWMAIVVVIIVHVVAIVIVHHPALESSVIHPIIRMHIPIIHVPIIHVSIVHLIRMEHSFIASFMIPHITSPFVPSSSSSTSSTTLVVVHSLSLGKYLRPYSS